MVHDIMRGAKHLVERAWLALTLAPAPTKQRPQLDGRRGYGERDIKTPEPRQ